MSTLTFDELEFDLERGRFCPVYLFLGPEEYLVRQALAFLKEKALGHEISPFNFMEFSAQDADASRIVQEANTFPLMSKCRLVLVRDIERLPAAGLEALAAYVRAPQEKTTLVLIAGEMDRRTGFYKGLVEHACVVEFQKIKGVGLEKWAGNFLARRGYRIAPAALKRLVDLAGSDLLTLANEMEKLILYAGKEKQIQDAAIDALVPGSRQHGIFELTAAIGKHDRKTALKLLGNLLESGEPPLAILSMMARFFRQVLVAQDLMADRRQAAEIRQATQIPDFALPEFLRQVQSMDPELARRMYQRLARIDLSFKSAGPDERMLLEHLICSL